MNPKNITVRRNDAISLSPEIMNTIIKTILHISALGGVPHSLSKTGKISASLVMIIDFQRAGDISKSKGKRNNK